MTEVYPGTQPEEKGPLCVTVRKGLATAPDLASVGLAESLIYFQTRSRAMT